MNEKPGQKVVQVVKDYGGRLFRFIRGRVKSDEDAEDILQEVWFQLSNVVDVEGIEQISGWLFRVARNKITDRYRKKKPDTMSDYEYEDDELGLPGLKDILLSDYDSPETAYIKELFWQELFAALEELPENQRQVFIWNELEDMTLQQIADQTGDKLKTIISRKGYAVKHLRRRLISLYEEFFID